jgi:fructokinase
MTHETLSAWVMGETLCDVYASSSLTLAASEQWTPRAGGAPANVATQLARLGVSTSLISALGQDPVGDRLWLQLQQEGIDTTHVMRTASRTGLTLVEVDEAGERRFFGWRARAADEELTAQHVRHALAHAQPALMHVGTVTLRAAAVRAATQAAITAAKKHGAWISVDVNLRPGMWTKANDMIRQAMRAVSKADVVKATDDEARQLLGASARVGPAGLARALLDHGPSMVWLTLGAQGCMVATRKHRLTVPSPTVNVVDATGAGDAFVGGAWAAMLQQRIHPHEATAEQLLAIATAGNRCGAAATTARGATTAMLRGLV